MSGSETGNVLIQDKREDDPFVWKYKKADRNGRIRYPEEVGNLMKETTEQVVTAVANPLTSAQFMTGRVLFAAGSTGASTLPTALTILTLLNNYYNFTKRSATYTNSNSVANRISSEISVEFSNQSGGTVTLAQGTGNTFVGFTSPVTIPDDATLRLKFVVVTSSPVAAFEVYIDGGNISQYANALVTPVVTLAAAAPDQLVVYDTATGSLGYVTDALMPVNDNLTKLMGWDSDTQTPSKITTLNAGDVNDVIMGWDATNQTPSAYTLADRPPQQAITRNSTNGQLSYSSYANYPIGTTTTAIVGTNATSGVLEKFPITTTTASQVFTRVAASGEMRSSLIGDIAAGANSGAALMVNATTSNVEQIVASVPLNQYKLTTPQVIGATTLTIVTFDDFIVTPGVPTPADVTYAAGVFTLTYLKSYIVTVSVETTDVAADYITLRMGNSLPGLELKRSSFSTSTIAHFTTLINAAAQGTQFVIGIYSTAGCSVLGGAGGLGLVTSVQVMLVH